MCKYMKLVLILLIYGFVRVDLNSDFSRIKRQSASVDIDNTILELFNDCSCVFYYQCSENNTVITNGKSLIDVRINENGPSENQNSSVLTCKGGKFEGELICCKLNGTTTDTRSPPINVDASNNSTSLMHRRCGFQRTKINVRVFTDEDNSIDGEFPWIVAIYKKRPNRDSWKFHASGALIHPKVILTANHYFNKKNRQDFKVILNGNIELPKMGEDPEHERNVEEIVNHPSYYGGALYNDGALLILDRPFESTRTNSINSICLPPDDVIESGRCMVAGWGKGSEEDGVSLLKKVELPLISFTTCQDLLRKTRLGDEFNLHNSFICAGGEKDKDACKGDGGSPLMCLLPSSTSYYHAGIVSWGIGCGQQDVPGVYASTAKMKQWILGELKKRNLEF